MRNIDYYKTIDIAKVGYNDYPCWTVNFNKWLGFEHVKEMPCIYGTDGSPYCTLTYEQAKAMAEAIPHEATWDSVKSEVLSKVGEVMSRHESDTNDQTTWNNIKKEVNDIMNPIVNDKLIYDFQVDCGDKSVFDNIENKVKMLARLTYRKTSESNFEFIDFEMMY